MDFDTPPDLIEQVATLRGLNTYPVATAFLKESKLALAAPAASALFSVLTEYLKSLKRRVVANHWYDKPSYRCGPRLRTIWEHSRRWKSAMRGPLEGILVKYAEGAWSKGLSFFKPDLSRIFCVKSNK